jgi:hypothetical protein
VAGDILVGAGSALWTFDLVPEVTPGHRWGGVDLFEELVNEPEMPLAKTAS